MDDNTKPQTVAQPVDLCPSPVKAKATVPMTALMRLLEALPHANLQDLKARLWDNISSAKTMTDTMDVIREELAFRDMCTALHNHLNPPKIDV